MLDTKLKNNHEQPEGRREEQHNRAEEQPEGRQEEQRKQEEAKSRASEQSEQQPDWWEETEQKGRNLLNKMKNSRSFLFAMVFAVFALMAWNMISSYPGFTSVTNPEAVNAESLYTDLEQIVQTMQAGTLFLNLQASELSTENKADAGKAADDKTTDDKAADDKAADDKATDDKTTDDDTTADDNTTADDDTAAGGGTAINEEAEEKESTDAENEEDQGEPEHEYLSYPEAMANYGDHKFFLLKKFLSYELADNTGKVQLSTLPESSQGNLLKDTASGAYSFWVRFTYNEKGELEEALVQGSFFDKQQQYQLEQVCYNYTESSDLHYDLPPVKGITIAFAMTEEAITEYRYALNSEELHVSESDYDDGMVLTQYDRDGSVIVMRMGHVMHMAWLQAMLIILAAILIPFNQAWKTGNEKIFHAPLELVAAVWFFIFCFAGAFEYNLVAPVMMATGGSRRNMLLRLITQGDGYELLLNFVIWFAFFAIVYWTVICLRSIFTMKGAYVDQRIWCVKKFRAWKANRAAMKAGKAPKRHFSLKRSLKKGWENIRAAVRKLYDALLHIDFQNETNRTILGIVVINFFVLLMITWLWFYGVFALLLYSVLLFFFLRKYFGDIRKKYALLHKVTNELAAGNLDVEIGGDFGIYNPVRDDLKKIQGGFQNAVQKEVKSERMKTELITNVSHDLKTPLTAIITYVDLLKSEQDEQKRKEYLDILDRKSQRLKVLIEDLFEISKAASKNVTLNLMNVDIVGLLKQAVFEQEDKIKAADLKFRWRLPEGKVVMALDSQKTYRIFENLVVNITKYALPGTRAYVDMEVTEQEVAVTMKNVSASELDFDTNEITDRFVRGDMSRNTEGSGLGLAIVKSFTELQRGTLTITTEADLFKICVRLPRRLIEPEQMVEAEQLQEPGQVTKPER